MRIVKLMGGLGNQMFQYAFGVALEHFHNDEVLFDASFFDMRNGDGIIPHREYQLNLYNTDVKIATKGEIFRGMYKRSPDNPLKLLENKIIENNCGDYNAEIIRLPAGGYYEGYFQNEKYFSDYREYIIKALTLKACLDEKNQILLSHIKESNSVSLHVRRGDYLKLQDIYEICDLGYYRRAVSYISSLVENPVFYVFSDDIYWVKENLKLDFPTIYVDINSAKDYFDLELMKKCSHNIIANSSFSWWGAWLNENPDKIVIAPQKWLKNREMLQNSIIPKTWVKI